MDRLPFELDRPWVLLAGAAALWLTVRIARRSIAGQPPGWLRFTLALRILLVVLLILSLGGVKVALKGKGFTLLVLRDVSASVPLRESEAILAQVAPHAEDQPGDVKIGLVVFGRNAAVEFAPRRAAGPPLSLGSLTSVVDREGTSIAAALRLAESAFTASHAGGARQVLLVTDGNATQGDELLEARNLALSGTVVDVIPIRYSHDREVLVDGLLVPPVVHPDEPFVVEAVIDSKVDTRARVQLYENDTLLETRELELLAGKTRVEVPLTRAGEGRYRYEVRVFPEPQSDSLTKNNVGHAFTMIHGEARVLFVGDAGEQSPLLQALTDSRIACEVVTPGEVPMEPESYFLYDTIIFADVPAHELHPDAMQLLHGIVKNMGIGLIMVGGPDSFGAGGYRGSPIERLLPVEMEVKQRKTVPNGALALILHTCEFAQGNLWAKRIAASAIDALSEGDYLGVLLWDGLGADRWGVPFGPAGDKAAIKAQIRGLQPADMPDFNPTMRLAQKALAGAPAFLKHAIIISDGDPQRPAASVMKSFTDSKITVTTICINPHTAAHTAVMKKIAKDTGGRYYLVKDPRKLPRIFFREALEIRRNLIVEEAFTPRIAYSSEVIRGFEEIGFPELHGYVMTTPKPLAESPLVSLYDDPILAHWRYGLARTAAFTSDATSRWGRDWIAWPGFDPFWAQLVRSVARRGAGELFRVDRVVEGDRGRILLDAVDAEGRFIDGIEIAGRLLDPRYEEEGLAFQQTGPGRYEAAFDAGHAGTYLLSLEYDDGAGLRGTTRTGLNVPYSPEYRQVRSDIERLEAIAAATGGRVLVPGDDPFAGEPPSRRQRVHLWDRLLYLSIFLLFFDIFFRRVLLDPAPLRRAILNLRWRRGAGAAPRSQTLGTLLQTRDSLKTRRRPRALETVATDGELPPRPAGEGEAQPGGEATARAAEAPEEFTDRLLRAKREARKRRSGKDHE